MDQEVGEDGASLRRLLLLLGLVGCGEAPVGSVEEPKLVSEHYEGLGVFAVQSERFPCDSMLQVMAELPAPALAFPFHTFGEGEDCVRRFVEQSVGKPHLLYVYVSNETCRKYGFCAEGDLFTNLSSEGLNRLLEAGDEGAVGVFERRFQDIREFVSRVGGKNTSVAIVTGLEDEYSVEAAKRLVALGRKYFSLVGENPEVRRAVSGDFVEVHGDRDVSPGGVANEDGVCHSVEETREFLRVNKGTFASFVWRAEWQGRECVDGRTSGPREYPRDRNFSFDPGIGIVWN